MTIKPICAVGNPGKVTGFLVRRLRNQYVRHCHALALNTGDSIRFAVNKNQIYALAQAASLFGFARHRSGVYNE